MNPSVTGPVGCRAWFQDDHYSPEGHWIECDDSRTHLTTIVDWIGNTPFIHGERDSDEERGPYENPCLCGHPDYMTCPSFIAGHDGILNLTIVPTGKAFVGDE